MAQEYVEKRNGGYYVMGSRVSLESVVYPFLDGASPETIVEEYPTLSLEQVYGTITFYLANRAKIEAYLSEIEKLWEKARKDQSPIPPALRERLERARRQPASA
ncbi:MAG: DUF433 domain-containing protein [Terriglobia bacterium]|jgi:uncharacterized protein (DUF433 family)